MIKKLSFLFVFFVVFCSGGPARSETVRLPAIRDLWISSAPGEEEGNNGGAPKLKLKGYQEFSIVDFDVESLKGKEIKKATLHLKLASDERLYRVAVGTITSPWNEGSGTGYNKEEGASSFRWRANPDVPWIDSDGVSPRYSDITSVIFGEGGAFWSNAEASPPTDGWQEIDVLPEVVAARVAGLSYGFVLFDDTGTEIVRKGDETSIRLFPNRFVFSHDQNRASEPFLEVEYEDAVSSNNEAPDYPKNLQCSNERIPDGAAIISWEQSNCLSDRIIGFHVDVDGKEVSQALVPAPAVGAVPTSPEERQFFEIRFNGLEKSKTHVVEISAVDFWGRKSRSAALKFKPSTRSFDEWKDIVGLLGAVKKPNDESNMNGFPTLGASQVAVVQEFDKFIGEKILPRETDGYLLSNAVWNARSKTIDLAAAKGEFVGFQIVFKGVARNVRFDFDWDASVKKKPSVAFYRLARVETSKGDVVDPAIPLSAPDYNVSLNVGVDSVLGELYVPKDAKPGQIFGRLRIIGEKDEVLTLNLRLKVWNFTIPDELCFLPEMNCYSLPGNELEYYRLAQIHRTYVNRVPYSHRGSVGDGLAPQWDASSRTFDWKEWTERFGRYFDGSAFADLPRGPVPIEAFYLPLFENFPSDIFKGFTGDFTWPDAAAFTETYRSELSAGCRAFAEKIDAEGWAKTRFLFFLNNKCDYKKDGWFRASSSWLLDEPASYRDFAALEFFGQILKSSVSDNQALQNKILYRADISRPQWERNSLDSLLDVYVVGGDVFTAYNATIRRRSEGRNKRLVYTYGTTAPPSESAYQPIFWSLDAWTQGADGIVPWQTIGNQDSWRTEDELSLFYPATKESDGHVAPSLRLKAYRSGEQLVEYLTLLSVATDRPRDEIARAVRGRLKLDDANSFKRDAEDAGVRFYNASSPDELESFKREIGDFLDRKSR